MVEEVKDVQVIKVKSPRFLDILDDLDNLPIQGVTVTCTRMTRTEPSAAPEIARSRARPDARALTVPDPSTEAIPSSSETQRLALAPPSADPADADAPTRSVMALPMVTAIVPAGPVALIGPDGAVGPPLDESVDPTAVEGITSSLDAAGGDTLPKRS